MKGERRPAADPAPAPAAGSARKPATAEDGERICVVLLTGLGDVVHGLPVVNALKRDDPSRRITWVVEPMPAPLLHGHPAVDEVVVFHKARGIAGVGALARELVPRSFDLTLNLNIYFKSVFPTVLSGASRRLGFDRARARDGVWLFCNRRLPPRPPAHTQDMFLEFLELLGVPSAPVSWELAPTAAERRRQAAFFGRFRRPVVAVVPASANPKKDWLAERYAALVDGLEREFGFASLIVGGPSERERGITEGILAAATARPEVALGDGIRRLMWLLDGSDLVVAPDTGPVHVARALGVPVIGLYGHTNPWRVGPYRAYRDLWVDRYNLGEEPERETNEPRHGRMRMIRSEEVLARVRRAVERYGVGRGPLRPSGEVAPDGART